MTESAFYGMVRSEEMALQSGSAYFFMEAVMANRNNIYRRQTKEYQKNMYLVMFAPESERKQTMMKYLSMAGIIIPAICILIGLITKNTTLLIFSIILWITCIAAVFINAGKTQRKLVRQLKEAGMSKKEFISQMKRRTKNKSQLDRYVKLWDKTHVEVKKPKKGRVIVK